MMKMPDAKELLASRREMMKRWMQTRAEAAKDSSRFKVKVQG